MYTPPSLYSDKRANAFFASSSDVSGVLFFSNLILENSSLIVIDTDLGTCSILVDTKGAYRIARFYLLLIYQP